MEQSRTPSGNLMNALNFLSGKKKSYTGNLVYSFREFTSARKFYCLVLRTPNVCIQVNDLF